MRPPRSSASKRRKVARWPSGRLRAAGRSDTTRPSAIRITRSARSIIAGRWATITAVRPSARSRVAVTTAPSLRPSSRAVGSSSSSTWPPGGRTRGRARPAAAARPTGSRRARPAPCRSPRGRAVDELVGLRGLRRRPDLLDRRVRGAEPDVVGHRGGEKVRALRARTPARVTPGIEVGELGAVDQHPARGGGDEAEQQVEQGALARAALADQRHPLAGRDHQRDVVERGLLAVRIAHGDVLQPDLRRDRPAAASRAGTGRARAGVAPARGATALPVQRRRPRRPRRPPPSRHGTCCP